METNSTRTHFLKSSAFILAAIIATSVLIYSSNSSADGSRSKVASGQVAPSFKAQSMAGKAVNFPSDYKGKVVLVDFWATWCGPCRHELPNVVEAYKKYHAKGLEVLSISLDKPDKGPDVTKYAKDNGMEWPQIYDGKFWKADLAVQYGIHAIPCPFLIDGDTGKVIGDAAEVLGENLNAAIEKSLAAKNSK